MIRYPVAPMRVLQFDMASELAPVQREIEAAALRVIASGRFIGGPEVEGFERELAAACGAAHAIGCSSGTDALIVTLMALGVGAGDEVITTPFTFFATAGAIARLGARPVFADVEDETLNLDPALAAAAIGAKTRAVIPVHLFGRPATIPRVDVPVVEDAAQAIGAPLGPIATLSFFPTKNLGAIGDAGAVLVRDDALAAKLAMLRNHGGRTRYHHDLVGGNFRLDAIQAAVLRAKLLHLPAWTAARHAVADRYRALFASSKIPAELRVPASHPHHVWHHFVIRAPRRDALKEHLLAAGVGCEVYYPVPLHRQPCFASLGYGEGSLPVAERAAADVLALPMYPTLGADAQAIVVDEIARFYRS
jgi:dTDP-4-amino-4,6-dideoxygalactose transaminase